MATLRRELEKIPLETLMQKAPEAGLRQKKIQEAKASQDKKEVRHYLDCRRLSRLLVLYQLCVSCLT